MSADPRFHPDCDDCPGEFVYQGQELDGRGLPESLYECKVCGTERRVR